jgi:tetratricopeptide (TPR) repeat protein
VGDLDQAIADYTEAIRCVPGLAAAYNNRGNAHLELGKLDDAIADFTAAIRIDHSDGLAHFNRGRAYEKKGDANAADADFAQAKQLGCDPTNRSPKPVVAVTH